MCDGKHSSKRDVVILSIKPQRPNFPTNQKVVPVSELLQEWDTLDAYYRGVLTKFGGQSNCGSAASTKSKTNRGQPLKLTKSFTKSAKHSKHSRHSITVSGSLHKVNNHKHQSSNKSSPVTKKHSSSASSDQFSELFGDENLFSSVGGPADSNNNNSRNHKSNKLLHSRSLNSLFDEDSLDDGVQLRPPNPQRHRKSTVNGNNLLVSIPVLSVQNPCGDSIYKQSKYYASDDDESGVSDVEDRPEQPDRKQPREREDTENFLSIPRDNFQVQYGTKQKTRVTLLETGNVSPRWIVPVRVSPYKPPTAQGLNGIQIQKILYHKNDSVNYPSPTTTSAKTPDKPPDGLMCAPPPLTKTVKVSSNSPVSTVSPRSATITATPPSENNNATPKQAASQTPELSSPKVGVANKKSPTTGMNMTNSTKLSPPVNSTSASGQKVNKRPTSLGSESHTSSYGKKPRLGETGPTDNSSRSFFMPVTSTSSTYSFSSSSSSSSSICSDTSENEHYSSSFSSSKHGHGSSSRSKAMETAEIATDSIAASPKKLAKNSPFTKPSPVANGDQAVFIPPSAISITDRIIKKASRPQPELIERQRRRKLESNQRKSYAMKMGDEHEERESIDLSMKSFEMIWNVPLLSPLRSP